MLDPLIIIPFRKCIKIQNKKYKQERCARTGILNKLIFRILWIIFGLWTDSFLRSAKIKRQNVALEEWRLSKLYRQIFSGIGTLLFYGLK